MINAHFSPTSLKTGLFGVIVLACAVIFTGAELAHATLVGINPSGVLSSVDLTTGDRTIIGTGSLGGIRSLAQSSSGVLYTVGGSTNDKLVTVNPTTGATTSVATLSYSGTPKPMGPIQGLAFSPIGDLFASAGGAPVSNLYRINPTTGVTTLVGNTGTINSMTDLAFSPSGTLYGWVAVAGLATINTTTGQATAIGSPNETQADNLAFSHDGTLWSVIIEPTTEGRIATIDLATGAVTKGASTYGNQSGIQFINEPAPVPVPAAVWLFGSGLAALVGYARGNNKRADV